MLCNKSIISCKLFSSKFIHDNVRHISNSATKIQETNNYISQVSSARSGAPGLTTEDTQLTDRTAASQENLSITSTAPIPIVQSQDWTKVS